jgi:Ser/Thr protein kinase RdoA (MazF antagonist)
MLAPDVPGAVEAYAALLHRLIRQAPAADAVPSLGPAPAWTAWDHGGPGVWPPPDDRPDDLNKVTDHAWLDEIARRVQRHLAPFAQCRRVVGHGDWEAHNLRWDGLAPVAVHDWDSVIAGPEPVVVGLAAAAWSAGSGPFPTIEQTAAFLEAYQRAAGGAWPAEEIGAAWAAGLWLRAFNEKKWRLDGHVALTEAEATERLRLAGAR